MKVDELKKYLKEVNLNTTGRKKVLAERLKKHLKEC